MNKELINQEWYEKLIEDCKDIIVECEFTARWALVEGYHLLGTRILEENHNFEREKVYKEKIVKHVAESLSKSPRTIWYSLQFAKKFPKLNSIPGGKNIGWRDVIKLLPEPKENKVETKLPEGEFNVVYADPPFRYEFSETQSRDIDTHYPSMDLEKIKNMVIPSAKDSILFLWAMPPKLEEAIQVLNAWGFTYKTCAVWDKEIIGMGYWFRQQHEILLVGTKGSFATPAEKNRVSSVIRSRRQQHSKKPNRVYEIIESYFPKGKYLEVFARSERKNWTSWGNEI